MGSWTAVWGAAEAGGFPGVESQRPGQAQGWPRPRSRHTHCHLRRSGGKPAWALPFPLRRLAWPSRWSKFSSSSWTRFLQRGLPICYHHKVLIFLWAIEDNVKTRSHFTNLIQLTLPPSKWKNRKRPNVSLSYLVLQIEFHLTLKRVSLLDLRDHLK